MSFSPSKDGVFFGDPMTEICRLTAERDAALATSAAQTRFIAAASHDLRQPLQALGLFVAALAEKKLSKEARGILGRIDSCVGSLDHLLRNLLDISRLDAGAIEVQPVSFPLRELFDLMTIEFEALAASKGLSIRFAPTRSKVFSDPVLMERILRNLIANAIRYTSRGGVVVGARRRGTDLRIEVWDTGKGIDETQQPLVFQEFHRSPGTEAGQGLGLAIVKRLAHLLDCRVDLRSKPGKGSMFAITVPAPPIK